MRLATIAFILCLAVPAFAADFDASALRISKEAKILTVGFSENMKANAALRAQDAPSYSTRCEIDGDTAYGYVTNHGRERLRLRGRIYWFFYDEDGDKVGGGRDRITKRISRRRTELVDKQDAPDDAKSCGIDVSEAVRIDQDEEENGVYSASCQIEGGRAVGYIAVRKTGSIRFRGRVTYYFYNSRGRKMSKKRARISVRVRRNNRKRVGEVSAPSGAVSCSLDISGTTRS